MALMPVFALAFGLLAPPEAPAAAAPVRGTHLLLLDGRVLEGDVERVGEQYRVRRRLGDSFLPARQVMYLGTGLDDVYRYLRGRVGPADADGRLKLAHWCRDHGLKAEALAEATEAARLRPGHPETVTFLRVLERLSAPAPAVAAAPPKPGAAEGAEPPAPELPPADCPAEAVALFNGKVQPLLMNLCAGCHAGGNGGNYRLIRTYPDSDSHQRATQANLAATFAQLNKARFADSPLLLKAVTAHGNLPVPPLKDRNSKSFKLLDEWARLALRLPPATATAALPPANPAPTPAPPTSRSPGTVSAAPPSTFGTAAPPTPPGKPKPPPVLDPTDPANFNPPPPPTLPKPGGK